MKAWIACASALALLAACGSSKDALAAWEAMDIGDGSSGMIQYEGKSGAGDKITLTNVTLGPANDGLKAKTVTFGGLGLAEDGKPLFSALAVKDITLAQPQPGVGFSLASINMDKIGPAAGVFLASAFKEGGPTEPPPPFEAWEVGKVAVNGLAVNADLAAMGMGAGAVNVYMDELSVSNLKDTIFGAAKFGGFKGDFNVPAEAGAGFPIVGKFDFGTADVKGIRGGIFAAAAEAGMNAAMNPAAMATLEADIMASMSSPLEAGFDSFTWTPITIEASGAKLATTRMEGKITRNAEGVAIASSSPRSTLTFSTSSADGDLGMMAGMFLSMIGYPTIELYYQADATYDPASDLTRYTDYTLGLTDGFELSLKGGFVGLTEAMTAIMAPLNASYDPFDPSAGMPEMGDLSGFKIADLELTLTDKSFVNKILPLIAQGDPEAMRQEIVGMLSSAGADFTAAGVDEAIANELSAAVSAFIQDPGTLKVKLAPAAPVAPMVEGADLSKTGLGFSVTHTPSN